MNIIVAYRIREIVKDGKNIQVKMCQKCKETKPVEEIYFRKERSRELAHMCLVCKHAFNRLNYRQNLQARRKYSREWNKAKRNPQYLKLGKGKKNREVREWLRALKTDNPCLDCGRNFHYTAMDFDHVRGTKKFQISTAVSVSVSQEVLLEELYKCDLVCSNCHRVRTWKRRQAVYSLKQPAP